MPLAPIRGRVACVFPADFDVDQIVGVEHIKEQDSDVLLAQVRCRLGDAFVDGVRAGDVLVGGANFGYGHPHFPAMRAMRRLGIAAVVADSFFPVYWRGEISNGFPQVPCPGIGALAGAGEPIEIDFDASVVTLPASGARLAFPRYGASDLAILEAGGFRPWLERSLAAERAGQR